MVMARRIFGSVEKRGKRYRARYQSEGRWVTAPVTFATKADANAWLANQQADTGRGVWVDRVSAKSSSATTPASG